MLICQLFFKKTCAVGKMPITLHMQLHKNMQQLTIAQLLAKIRKSRLIGKVAEKAGRHRNTVSKQVRGLAILEPEVVVAATKTLEEEQQEKLERNAEIQRILEDTAPLLAGLD